jgi:hypothetical protein
LATAALKWAMKSQSVAAGEERTFVLILDQGEEAFKAITDFADKQCISGASVSAVGAFRSQGRLVRPLRQNLQDDRRRRAMRSSQRRQIART